MDREFGTPGGTDNQWFPVRKFEKTSEAFPKFCWWEIGSSGNHAKMIFRWSGQNTISEVYFYFFFCQMTPGNHENTTFQTFLEPWGPRDPPWMQERKILFRIALTRALYDQMAPQLCHFYISATVDFFVPRQPTIFCVNLATRRIIITNVSGGRSRRGKSFLYYSALPLAGTKKRRPKT